MGLFDIFKKKPVDGTYRRDESGAGFAQDGVYSDPERFCIVVEDVFSITGRGTVITGQVRSGRVAVGDRVTLKRLDGSVREVNIGGIEMFRRMLDKAEKGDNVGILLRGKKRCGKRGYSGEVTMARYALISDIHGNFKALEAFLEYIQGHPVDGIISLGDYVTDGPYPEKTMELLYGMRERYVCHMIRGNREDYLLDNVNNKEGWKPSSANGTLYYTLLSLSKRDMEFFASLPTEREVVIEGCPPLYICHGTPGRVRGNVQWEEGLKEKILRELPRPYDYLLGGHSHHQEIERHGGKTYINPGSLGFAMDGVGKHGQFAVLTGDGEGWRTEFLSIPYDVSAYLEAFAVSGVDEIGMTLNKAVKKSLVTGVNYFFRCIQAMEEEAKNVGAGSMAELPEAAWELLAERFGL